MFQKKSLSNAKPIMGRSIVRLVPYKDGLVDRAMMEQYLRSAPVLIGHSTGSLR